MKYTLPRGTKDILPDEIGIWQFIEETCRKIFELYNYAEIRTPIFEQTDLFARAVGSTTDIVTKEMYVFQDKKGRSLALRPEATASVVRACIQNNLISQGKVTKLYYLGPMFRYERPQAGRYRQFHQAGVEVFGSNDPLVDAEVIEMAVKLFEKLGLKDLEVDINSVGCRECQPAYRDKLKKYFKDIKKNLCKDCQARLDYNPLRILDCKEKNCQKYIQKAPASIDTLCRNCKLNFEQVTGYLDNFKIKYVVNNRLVRGLDYYTQTTFEVVSKVLGAQNAVCGGGRYDNLVEDLGGKDTPASGFAIGIERVVEVMRSSNLQSPFPILQLFIIVMGEESKKKGFELLREVRANGIKADMDYLGKSLKSQLKTADRLKAKYAYIIGDDELKKGKGLLKNMKEASQEEISFNDLIKSVKEK